MLNRMLIAVAAALIGLSSAVAQAPIPAPPAECDAPASAGAWWVSADFLIGRINGPTNLIPFVTTSPSNTPRLLAGVAGEPSTTVLFGSSAHDANGFNEDMRIGFRLGAGVALRPDLNLEAGFAVLESQSTVYSAASDGTTVLARPYLNPERQVPLGETVLVAYPGVSSGTIDFRVSSSTYLTGCLDLAETFCDKGWVRFESLLGYRFYRLDGGLTANQVVNPLEPNFVPGTVILTNDQVTTDNEFHGAEVGLRSHFEWEALTVSLEAKVAGGNLRRRVRIAGSTTSLVPGQGVQSEPAGFFALRSNSGTYGENGITAVPEFGALLRWRVLPNLTLRAGGAMTMLGRAVSPEGQLDLVIDPDLLPPGRGLQIGDRPRFRMIREDIWVQAIQLGAELTW